MSTYSALQELEASVEAYWRWIATDPVWAGLSLEEVKSRYIDNGHDGPDYERLLHQLERGVLAVIDVAK
ncbi:hypothetical protein, partial [Hymenobacter crusticola]